MLWLPDTLSSLFFVRRVFSVETGRFFAQLSIDRRVKIKWPVGVKGKQDKLTMKNESSQNEIAKNMFLHHPGMPSGSAFKRVVEGVTERDPAGPCERSVQFSVPMFSTTHQQGGWHSRDENRFFSGQFDSRGKKLWVGAGLFFRARFFLHRHNRMQAQTTKLQYVSTKSECQWGWGAIRPYWWGFKHSHWSSRYQHSEHSGTRSTTT